MRPSAVTSLKKRPQNASALALTCPTVDSGLRDQLWLRPLGKAMRISHVTDGFAVGFDEASGVSR